MYSLFSVGIAAGYGLDGRGLIPVRDKRFFFPHSTVSRPAEGPIEPPIQSVPGDHYPIVRRTGRESDISPPFSAEIKKSGAIPPIPHMTIWSGA
jgi:hypothetical protein